MRNSSIQPKINQTLTGAMRLVCGNFADCVVLDQVVSSNQYLLEQPPPVNLRSQLVWALEQPGARGRRGRAWVGEPEHSLMLSMAFFRDKSASAANLAGLPIAIGVALAQALAVYAPLIKIKWPNDLTRNHRKCGGILIEARQRMPEAATIDGDQSARVEQVVVGVGINLYVDSRWQSAIDQPACGLFDRQPYPPRATIAVQIAKALNGAWLQYLQYGLTPSLAQWTQWDALFGEQVCVMDAGRLLFEGLAQGLAASGALRVHSAAGLQEVNFGDVSVRKK